MGLACVNLTLTGGRPGVAGKMGYDGHFVGTLFEVWVRVCLVPINTLTKTGSGTKYKWFSIYSNMAWDKLPNPCFNRSICKGYCSTLVL